MTPILAPDQQRGPTPSTPGQDGRRVRLVGQVALVTGASSGMGLATARAFAQSGAAVVLADVNTQGSARSSTAPPSAAWSACPAVRPTTPPSTASSA